MHVNTHIYMYILYLWKQRKRMFVRSFAHDQQELKPWHSKWDSPSSLQEWTLSTELESKPWAPLGVASNQKLFTLNRETFSAQLESFNKSQHE